MMSLWRSAVDVTVAIRIGNQIQFSAAAHRMLLSLKGFVTLSFARRSLSWSSMARYTAKATGKAAATSGKHKLADDADDGDINKTVTRISYFVATLPKLNRCRHSQWWRWDSDTRNPTYSMVRWSWLNTYKQRFFRMINCTTSILHKKITESSNSDSPFLCIKCMKTTLIRHFYRLHKSHQPGACCTSFAPSSTYIS